MQYPYPWNLLRTDSLIEAVKDLEVAIDDFTQAVYFFADGSGVVVEFGNAVVEAAVAVAVELLDADVTVKSDYTKIVPAMLVGAAAAAEIATFRRYA